MHIALWILAPLISSVLGYLCWQAMRAQREVARVLRDESAIEALFARAGKQLLEQAVSDPRIRAALQDETRLALSTTILHRGIERRYRQIMLSAGIPVLALAGIAGVVLHPLAVVLVLAAGAAGLLAPPPPAVVQHVRRDLGALALSLKIWYEYDPEICTDVINVTGIFEPLFAYVKAHYVNARKVGQ